MREYKITIDDLRRNNQKIKHTIIGSKKVGLPNNQKDFAGKLKDKSNRIIKERVISF